MPKIAKLNNCIINVFKSFIFKQFKNENKKVEINEPNIDRPPTNLITDYNNNEYKPKPNLSNKTVRFLFNNFFLYF